MEIVGHVTKVLTEMSYLRFFIDLNVTRQLSGTKIEFMEPIKPLGKKPGMLLKGFLRALPCKEGYFLLGTRTSGYLEGLEGERLTHKDRYCRGSLFTLKRLLQVQSAIPYEKFQESKLKYGQLIYLMCLCK